MLSFVISGTSSTAAGELLKKQLNADNCWSLACTNIVKSHPLLLLRYHRISSSLSRFFEGEFILNPFRAACPLCSKIICLKIDSTLSELIRHITLSHQSADHYLDFIQISSSNLFKDSPQSSVKLAVNRTKADMHSIYKMPIGM